MFKRLSNTLLSNSFFIFGARGAGKSTLVKELFSKSKTLVIALLNADELELFYFIRKHWSKKRMIFQTRFTAYGQMIIDHYNMVTSKPCIGRKA